MRRRRGLVARDFRAGREFGVLRFVEHDATVLEIDVQMSPLDVHHPMIVADDDIGGRVGMEGERGTELFSATT
jgi:hypothetical protein